MSAVATPTRPQAKAKPRHAPPRAVQVLDLGRDIGERAPVMPHYEGTDDAGCRLDSARSILARLDLDLNADILYGVGRLLTLVKEAFDHASTVETLDAWQDASTEFCAAMAVLNAVIHDDLEEGDSDALYGVLFLLEAGKMGIDKYAATLVTGKVPA